HEVVLAGEKEVVSPKNGAEVTLTRSSRRHRYIIHFLFLVFNFSPTHNESQVLHSLMSDTLETPESDSLSSLKQLSISPNLPKTFSFFLLPTELRSRILSLLLCPNSHLTVDISEENHRTSTARLNYFLVSKRFGYEAYHVFYSTHTFRIFPTNYSFIIRKRTVPLLARLPVHYLNVMTKLELRLGPAWSDAPKYWVITNHLGLQHCQNVRTLKIFIEVDPSGSTFKGYILNAKAYTDFCGDLLQQIMERLPLLETIEYDAYSNVERDGPLMTRLLEETTKGMKKISW
ncbi:MAG: hypothetical protein Q9204_008588, partial [Flavoplaca sp. TL-2023a]